VEIRKVICSTNAIESVNARIRKAVRARGHFPNETAALKCVYMALMSLDPTGAGRRRWTMRELHLVRFAQCLAANGILRSMGSVSDSYDDALMENFWST